MVFLPACDANSTACFDIDIPIPSSTILNSSAASSPTLSPPDFFIILYMLAKPNSDSDIQYNAKGHRVKKFKSKIY